MVSIAEIRPFYVEAFAVLDRKRHDQPEIRVEFYPYIGINHTIRIRDGVVIVRVGELCRDMPLNAHKALAYILVSKLLRHRIPAEAKRIYGEYSRSHSMVEKARHSKRTRGKKIVSGARGSVYDLEGVFEKVNQVYFENRIPKPVLSWSARKTYRTLGHHDAAHGTIVISRSLDSADVPKYVVEYVMFHEMLHIVYPVRTVNGRRNVHPPEFLKHEREFVYFDEADLWIKRNAAGLRRRATR